jgi:lipopolysaccharide assembly outer membrane protein LptD (OstA)
MIQHAENNIKASAVLGFLLFIISFASAQVTPPPVNNADTLNNTDTLKIVKILSANRYAYQKKDSVNELLLLVGKVAIQQGDTKFYADSAVYNRHAKVMEAFGNVQINDHDSVHTYSDYLLYHTDTKIAILKKNVRLTDGKSNLYTQELEYDLNNKIGIYRNGGKVINGTSVLTSDEGTYYADIKDVYFKHNVKLVDPQYNLDSDSLLYNTASELATFISKTYIVDSARRTIETTEGYYDMKSKTASFGNRPIIKDGPMTIIANQVDTDDKTGISILGGNAVFKDTSQGISVLANSIVSNRNLGTMVATQHPLMIIKQENDSTFIAADTLYSGRLSELPPVMDSVFIDTSIQIKHTDTIKAIDSSQNSKVLVVTALKPEKPDKSKRLKRKQVVAAAESKKPPAVHIEEPVSAAQNPNDSTDRYFRAYHHVRIFSDSLQSVCDSLFYSAKDSIFRLFTEPIVWSGSSQVTGDTIYMYTKNKKPHELYVFEDGLMINQTGVDMYNQVRGNRIFGYFREGEIDYIRSKGNAESIYYAKDNDDRIVGINKATSDIIDMRFINRELNRVVFISAVTGTMLPFSQAAEEDKRLRNFKWFADKRPKTKFELFGN